MSFDYNHIERSGSLQAGLKIGLNGQIASLFLEVVQQSDPIAISIRNADFHISSPTGRHAAAKIKFHIEGQLCRSEINAAQRQRTWNTRVFAHIELDANGCRKITTKRHIRLIQFKKADINVVLDADIA